MPELPDIRLYVTALQPRLVGQSLVQLRLLNPFVLRSVEVPPTDFASRKVSGVSRIGKRIVLDLEGGLHVVVHLMIAGRFRWLAPGAKPPGRIGLAAFEFAAGTLVLTEAGTRRRASIHLVRGSAPLAEFQRGGIDTEAADPAGFAAAIRRENHTLKRALTDPTIVDGIGNAYSDEILHHARLSPLQWTSRISDGEMERLRLACRTVLGQWTTRLRDEVGDDFPQKVTAFRAEMAVHGRYNLPCPVCGHPIQRIRYAENETNYCAHCQTGGRLLADRGLSRLLHDDWPRTLEELEEHRRR
jgi:formamidopyrimidine-DNA glycosylase